MSKISADNLSNQADTKEIPTDTVIAGSAKAWVNFNGTGVVAIRSSFNVSSITDNGTGDYTVNFTNAMSDVNYSIAGVVSATGMIPTHGSEAMGINAVATNSVRIVHNRADVTAVDSTENNVIIFAN